MSSHVLRQLVKNQWKVHNGTWYTLRTMCNKEINRDQSAGHHGKSQATYGAPEFFQYNEYSFNDIHCEMEKHRLPRPTSKAPKENK